MEQSTNVIKLSEMSIPVKIIVNVLSGIFAGCIVLVPLARDYEKGQKEAAQIVSNNFNEINKTLVKFGSDIKIKDTVISFRLSAIERKIDEHSQDLKQLKYERR